MTENEAKTKWCPFSQTHPPNGPRGYSRNRTSESAEIMASCRCIGSACMAWRATDNECTNPTYDANTTAVYVPNYAPAGYCGLAGK